MAEGSKVASRGHYDIGLHTRIFLRVGSRWMQTTEIVEGALLVEREAEAVPLCEDWAGAPLSRRRDHVMSSVGNVVGVPVDPRYDGPDPHSEGLHGEVPDFCEDALWRRWCDRCGCRDGCERRCRPGRYEADVIYEEPVVTVGRARPEPDGELSGQHVPCETECMQTVHVIIVSVGPAGDHRPATLVVAS